MRIPPLLLAIALTLCALSTAPAASTRTQPHTEKAARNPSPESPSLLLLGSGILGVAIIARRKQAKH